MKIERLIATQVHGYLPIDVTFRDDLTFLTGLNGSGKTSALRLLMGLLTPQLEELIAISFSTAVATVMDGGTSVLIRAERSDSELSLSVSGVHGSLKLTAADFQLLTERRPEDNRPVVYARLSQDSVFKKIVSMSTPMFLGLDRRFYYSEHGMGDLSEARRRDFHLRRMSMDAPEGSRPGAMVSAGLADVSVLIADTIGQVRAEQEQLDDRLRNQFFLGSLQYEPVQPEELAVHAPSRQSLENYRQRQAQVEIAVAGLQLPVAEVREGLTKFFDRMNEIVGQLESISAPSHRSSKPSKKKGGGRPAAYGQVIFNWLVNKRQADRIFAHIERLEQYNVERQKLREPIERVLNLVNEFLKQTAKRVEVGERGYLEVVLEGSNLRRPITALSSGERQILVMLVHLSLNKRLAGSGVFIVDEPELSLHVAWQERFVDAIREANPSVQLIMATHSPAIILDRRENCRSLS